MWQNACAGDGEGRTCVTSQGIYREGGELMFGIEVRTDSRNPGPLLRVITPLGLLLPKGVTVLADNVEVTSLSYERCAEKGCEAFAPLTPEMVAALTAGAEMEIQFWPAADKPQQIVVPLTDFAKNYAEVSQ